MRSGSTARHYIVPAAVPLHVVALARYDDDAVRRRIIALKSARRSDVVDAVARDMVHALATTSCTWCAPIPDVVTWVPASHQRVRRTGVDATALVAELVARALDTDVRALLRRRGRARQSSSDRAARLVGPDIRASPRACGRSILIVDDVTTTGATLRRAVDALVNDGDARHVRAVVAAWTPRPPGRGGDG
jgi:predicted amidophosphoribosyltransferase